MNRLVIKGGLILASLSVGMVAMQTHVSTPAAAAKTVTTFPKKMRGTWYYRDAEHYRYKTTFTKRSMKLTTWHYGKSQGTSTYKLVKSFTTKHAVNLTSNGHGWYTVSWTNSNMWKSYKRGTYTLKGHKYAALYTGMVGVAGPMGKKASFAAAMHQDRAHVYTKKVAIKGLR